MNILACKLKNRSTERHDDLLNDPHPVPHFALRFSRLVFVSTEMRVFGLLVVGILFLLLSSGLAKKKKKKKRVAPSQHDGEEQQSSSGIKGYVNNADSLLFAAKDNALPASLFNHLIEECRAVGSWSGEEESFMHGKKPTFWLDLTGGPEPRNYIEKAVLALRKEVMPRIYSHRKEQTIVGGEWWVQVRDGKEAIGFHYDKDEAMASIQGKMKMPLVSTVTYLTSIGAPTLILNQTTIDGNMEVPEVPEEGYLSYPKPNRHIMFSGDLQHGVLGTAAPAMSEGHGGRVTLLINWWDVSPLEPNTRPLTDDLAHKMGIDTLMGSDEDEEYEEDDDDMDEADAEDEADVMEVEMSGTGDTLLKPVGKHRIRNSEQQEANLLRIPTVSSENMRHRITLPPGDMFFVYLPKDIESGLHRIKWKRNETFGSVGDLDLSQQTQVGQLFRLPEPKALIIYNKKDKKTYKKLLNSVLPIAKKYLGSVKFYFCSSDKTEDLLSAFDLTKKDLPRLAIHDTQTDEKFVQPAEEFSTKASDIEAFLKTRIDLEGKEYMHK